MQNKKLSIRTIVSYLNDEESEGGGFWLPNIQRPFVWGEEQITKLFDSIMRQYPISTLLIWKTKENLKHRRFIDNYRRSLKLTDFYVPEHGRSKLIVLDGQQRLQSLFIGLKGSYEGKELYFDVLSGALAAPDEIRFRFAFLEKVKADWPWTRFKDLIAQNNKLPSEMAEQLATASPAPLSQDEFRTVSRNVDRSRQEFVNNSNVTYQELDGIDNPDAYSIDDIVEVFIRANDGGTKLGKSDLLFSLLAANWEAADGEIEALLGDLNKGDFAFDRDFVLKACLTALDRGSRYEVAKFRDGRTKEELVEKWQALAEAIKAVRDFVVTKTYVRSDKAMLSYQGLIPLIYYCYHFRARFAANKELAAYFLRVQITGVFSGSPDNLIDKVVGSIRKQGDFVLSEVYGVIRADQRSLEITPDVVLDEHYGSRTLHLFFNLWYREFDYSPALDANGPQVDHIFPQSLLKSIKDANPETGVRNILHYRAQARDQIANCMLLSAEENGFQNKSGTPPREWFARSRFDSDEDHAAYLGMHLIPNDPALWELERYEDFIAARKALITHKFAFMLRPATG